MGVTNQIVTDYQDIDGSLTCINGDPQLAEIGISKAMNSLIKAQSQRYVCRTLDSITPVLTNAIVDSRHGKQSVSTFVAGRTLLNQATDEFNNHVMVANNDFDNILRDRMNGLSTQDESEEELDVSQELQPSVMKKGYVSQPLQAS